MSARMYPDGEGGERNMYDCTACPKCRSTYRYPMKDRMIHCDDCPHVEPWDAFMVKQLDPVTP